MKKAMAFMWILGVFTLSAYAVIGETIEQSKLRYGEGTIDHSPTTSTNTKIVYKTNYFTIYTEFEKKSNKCISINYVYLDNKPLEIQTIITLLDNNFNGGWIQECDEPLGTVFISKDGNLSAVYHKNSKSLDIIILINEAIMRAKKM